MSAYPRTLEEAVATCDTYNSDDSENDRDLGEGWDEPSDDPDDDKTTPSDITQRTPAWSAMCGRIDTPWWNAEEEEESIQSVQKVLKMSSGLSLEECRQHLHRALKMCSGATCTTMHCKLKCPCGTFYCGPVCQKNDWPRHRKTCTYKRPPRSGVRPVTTTSQPLAGHSMNKAERFIDLLTETMSTLMPVASTPTSPEHNWFRHHPTCTYDNPCVLCTPSDLSKEDQQRLAEQRREWSFTDEKTPWD